MSIEWAFDSQLFESATIARWSGYFERILQAICAQPEALWEAISLLDSAERSQLLNDFNRTEKPKFEQCIHTLFEQQVAIQPDAIAVVYQSETLSYAAFNQRANQIAHTLIAQGIQADDRVVVLIERSLESVLAMLAILKAGAAYVPVDPSYPQDRIDFMLADAQPFAILVASGSVAIPDAPAPVLPLDQLYSSQTHNPNRRDVTPQHLAYLIYTSGSTGRPKGAMLEHRQLANLLGHAEYAPGPNDCASHCVNPAFDGSAYEIWSALCHGARLVVIAPSLLLQPRELANYLLAQGVNTMLLPVGLFNHYQQALAPVWRQLKYCLIGGEAVNAQVAMQVLQTGGPKHLINIYGPTEATVYVSTHDLSLVRSTQAAVPIGRPIANCQIYLLDRLGEPVPIGVIGEICIGGAQVARGYWNRPELTAEKFLSNPFVAEADTNRLYRSGDLGCWRADGVLEFVGRNDFQFKIRGFRVELGEIESVLRHTTGVKEAAVIAQEVRGAIRLVAYVVLQSEPLSAEWFAGLAAQLAKHLPDYMLPSEWVRLSALPLTAHGKLDRSALPLPEKAGFTAVSTQPPHTASEQLLAQHWQIVLDVADVGRQDNFFALGGHSLLAVRLSESLRQQGYRLDVRTIFQAATLAEMAELIGKLEDEVQKDIHCAEIDVSSSVITPDMLPLLQIKQAQIDSIVDAVPGGVSNIQDMYPLSPLQEGILFHHLMLLEQDPYLLSTLISFDTRTGLDQFLTALQQVINRHAILRTGIHWRGLDQPVQVVQRRAPLEVMEHPAEFVRPLDVLQSCLESARANFVLDNAPMLRICAMRDAASERWLLGILAHHLVIDHQTMALIFAEILLILRGQQALLPNVIPFKPYVTNQLNQTDQRHEAFFRRNLADYTQPAFVFNVQDDDANRHQMLDANLTFGPELIGALREQARLQRVSLATLMHLAWGLVVSACSGQDDVVFGTVLSGRLHAAANADQALGLFINTLPVRVQLAQLSVQECVKALARQLNELTEHEQAPLTLARRCSGVAPELPLFNVLFNYRHKQSEEDANRDACFAELGIRFLQMEERTHYPLTLSLNECDDSLQLSLQAIPRLHPQRLLSYLHTAVENLLSALAQASTTPVSLISVIPQSEREQLLRFSSSAKPVATPALVHMCFEQHAERAPEAIAIVSGELTWSYAELNARANAFAHRLLAQGVQPNDRVAVCLERGPDLVAALLGVLKAGAGYVPLDPAHPAARLAFCLQDSAPLLLITSESLCAGLDISVPILCVESLPQEHRANPQIDELGPQHLAYVIYTSGSTGQPKGVMVEHQQLGSLFSAAEQLFQFNAADVWTLFHSCAFDFSVWEMWGALTSGARLVVPATMTRASDEFYQLVCRQQVTVLNQTPSALQTFLTAQEAGHETHHLRYVVLGGEATEPHLVDSWQRLNASTPSRLINMYGITEITVHGTFSDLTDHQEEADFGLLGKPLPDTEIYLLDQHAKPVPMGVTGEIYIGGAQVARGYWQRAELNAQRFLPNPFSAEPGARLYRSGDLASWRENGTLDYRGRNDFQVKLRGYRIELGEIEAQLRALETVRNAVVVVQETNSDRRLVAYVVMAPNAELRPLELREALSQQLAEYMLPSVFMAVESLPLTVNGKVDLRALPAPEWVHGQADFEPPQGEIECRLASVWESLLGIQQPGRQDHFLALGGHSLLAIKLTNAIQQEWKLSLPLRTVFELGTIAKLADAIKLVFSHSAATAVSEECEEGVFI